MAMLSLAKIPSGLSFQSHNRLGFDCGSFGIGDLWRDC
jgi:hypothetical protein